MKAVLSNRIYLEVDKSYKSHVEEQLTYTIPGYTETAPSLTIRNYSVVRPNILSIPIGRQDLIPDNYEIVDKRIKQDITFPPFKFDLRQSQQEVYDVIHDNAIINAWTSWGKTFTGLAIAGKLGQKTLVVTHTIPLRNQWVKEAEKVFGITPGIIGSGKFEIDKQLVIANTQTLYRNLPKVSRQFGTVILDEMHHVSSPTFSKIIDSNYARYKIGLSGTLIRKDGQHIVFRDYFSNHVIKPPKENYLEPVVHVYKPGIKFIDGMNTPWAIRVNKLKENEAYQHMVALLGAKYAHDGHNVLLVSDRVEFLNKVASLIGDNAVAITGEVPQEERERLLSRVGKDIKVICGIQSIFSEGISVDALSCLILATPVNNESLLTQLIGRIIRLKENKPTPVIVDINLDGNTANRQANSRLGVYIKEGYKVHYK